MRVQRLYIDRAVPTSSYYLGEALSIILIGLVDLHLERRPRMTRIQTNHIETLPSEFVHQPRCHRSGLDTDIRIMTCMAAD